MATTYKEGNITYTKLDDGTILKQVGNNPPYKVDPANYKYVPTAIGGTRDVKLLSPAELMELNRQGTSTPGTNVVNTIDPLTGYTPAGGSPTTGSSLYKKLQKLAQPTLGKTISYDQAVLQAQNQLNPLYDQLVKKSLEAEAKRNIARGFYGQLPADVLMQSVAADVEGSRAAAINEMANQLLQQDAANKLAAYNAALQAYNTQANLLSNLLGMETSDYWKQVGFDYQKAQDAFERAIREAGLTGQYGGQPTLEAQQNRLANELAIAGLTGQYQGTPTLAARELELNRQKLAQSGSSSAQSGSSPAISLSRYVTIVRDMLGEQEKVPVGKDPKTGKITYQNKYKYTISDIMDYLAMQNLTPAQIAEILNIAGINLTDTSLGRSYINVKPR